MHRKVLVSCALLAAALGAFGGQERAAKCADC